MSLLRSLQASCCRREPFRSHVSQFNRSRSARLASVDGGEACLRFEAVQMSRLRNDWSPRKTRETGEAGLAARRWWQWPSNQVPLGPRDTTGALNGGITRYHSCGAERDAATPLGSDGIFKFINQHRGKWRTRSACPG